MATKLIIFMAIWMFTSSFAQQDYNEQDQLGYTCSPGSPPCQAYASFRAGGSYNTIKEAAALFRLSEEQVATPSNLQLGSPISKDQFLLIPLNCSCVSGRSQYNISYIFQKADTMYLVSYNNFQGLTTYQAVERANPTVEPTKIQPGDTIIFPIRCGCPSRNQSDFKSLLTYGSNKGDTLSDISASWNVSQSDIVSENTDPDLAKNLIERTTILLPMKVNPPVLPKQTNLVPVTPAAPPPTTTSTSPVPPTDGNTGLSTGAIVGISVGSALVAAGLIVIAGFGVFCLVKKKKNSRMHHDDELSRTKTYSAASHQNDFSSQSFDNSSSLLVKEAARKQNQELIAGMADLDSEKKLVYSYAEIQDATNNFSPSHLIQGSVYQGMLRGELVAIKETKGGTTSQEIKILAKVHHSNLVKLVGVCAEDDQFFLVYEYAENGSLSRCLHDKIPGVRDKTSGSDSAPPSSVYLSWNARLQIALDVATGLEYIHDYTQPSFVHKDIKSSNILLDAGLRAKIANFGMARLTEGTDGSSLPPALTKHISGTQGYMAPEYLTHGFVSTKVDVYAFGVVMMELITGREAVLNDSASNQQQRFLSQVIVGLMDRDDDREGRMEKLRQWVDPTLDNLVPWGILYSFTLLARACVDVDPNARPGMKDITFALSKMLDTSLQWETEMVLERRYNSAQITGR